MNRYGNVTKINGAEVEAALRWVDGGKAVWDTNVMRYCPNCGADMREGEK